MQNYKIILGIVSSALAFVSYGIYFRNIFKGLTKPHAFSWFVWGLLTAILLAVQTVEKGGAGSWVNIVSAIACFLIAGIAYFKGYRDYAKSDWYSFIGALLAIIIWVLTKN